MADRELAFSTFLKLLELTEGQKEAALRGFLRGGGFSYWRPLQILAPEVVAGQLSLSGVAEKMALLAKGHQRKYNEHALTSLLKWVGRRRVQPRQRPERIVRKFGNSGLKVRLEPEVSFSMDGQQYLMHVWATNSPTLSEETLSMGLFFFRHHFREAGAKESQFLIFDTVKDRIFAEFGVLHNAAEMLAQQRELLSTLWFKLNTEGVEQRPPVERRRGTGPEDEPNPGAPAPSASR